MSYLDNSVITVDAVLTKKGRERLGQGRDAFKITKFAVADDEIDYSLYNTAHPLGSNYYANIIENLPVLEAIPDETQVMRFKLVTLPEGTSNITNVPVIRVGSFSDGDTITLRVDDTQTGQDFTPVTNFRRSDTADPDTSLDQQLGYTMILFDEDAALIDVLVGVQGAGGYVAPPTQETDPRINFSTSIVKVGKSFRVRPNPSVQTQKNTKIRIYGNESGATLTLNLTVNPRITS